MVEEKALAQALSIFCMTGGDYLNFQLERGSRRSIDKIVIRFASGCDQKSCHEYLRRFASIMYDISSSKDPGINYFPLSLRDGNFNSLEKERPIFKIPLTPKVIANLRNMFILNFLCLKIERAKIPPSLRLDENDKEKYVHGFSFSQQPGHPHLKIEQITKSFLRSYGFKLFEGQVNVPGSGLENYVFVLKDGIGQAVTRAVQDFPQLINQQKESPYMLFNVFNRDMQAKSRLIDRVSMPQIVNNSVIFRCYNKSQQMINNKEAVKEINKLYGPSLVKLSDDKQYITLNFNYNTISTIMEQVPCDVNYLNKAHQLACKQASGSLEVEEKLSEARDGAASSTSYRPDVPSTSQSFSHKHQGGDITKAYTKSDMEKFAFIINMGFLILTANYTTFQFKVNYIYILFPNGKREKCMEYLEQVTAKYKEIITSFKDIVFDIDSFPFCISPGRLSSKSRMKEVKIKVHLTESVLRNIHHTNNLLSDIFDQLSLCEENIPDMPSGGKKRIVNLESSQISNNSDLKTKLSELYSKGLLTLFNIFYHNISSQDPQKGETDLECMQLIKAWGGSIHEAKVDRNIVYFNHFYSHNSDILRDKGIIQKIYGLYGGKKTREALCGFISIQEGSGGDAKVSFNFDPHNIDIIMAKVPCDIGYVQKARKFASKQMLGTASPVHTAGSSGVSPAVGVWDKGNQSSNLLQVPESDIPLNRDGSVKSNESNDSGVGASSSSNSNPKSELHPNATSFDSGRGSNPSSPTKKYKSHQSTPAVSPTSSICTIVKAASIANMKDLESPEPKPDKVRSERDMGFCRSKSAPLCGDRKVLSTVKVEKGVSLDDIKSNVLF